MQLTPHGLMRQQENGARHRGAIRGEAAREAMRQAAIARQQQRSKEPTPRRLREEAAALVMRGHTQRQAARAVGLSLGALQRHLRAIGA
jgi:hypothetical protein